MRVELPARRDALEAARQTLLQWLEPQAPSAALVYRAELVLEEVLMNIAWHAYPGGGEHRMWFEAEFVPGGLVLRFEDEGIPFDPTCASAPEAPADLAHASVGGLGVPLVKKFAQALRYERRDGRNHLDVQLAC